MKIFSKSNNYVSGKLGYDVRVGRETIISERAEIGDCSKIGGWTEIQSGSVGRFCAIGDYCSIGGAQHPASRVCMSALFYLKSTEYYEKDWDEYTRPPVIGNDVWIGNHVNILQGVTIGDGAIIGAGAVVTKDVGPYEVWGGVPAQFIKLRFDESLIKKIEGSGIWAKPTRWIIENRSLLSDEAASVDWDSLE